MPKKDDSNSNKTVKHIKPIKKTIPTSKTKSETGKVEADLSEQEERITLNDDDMFLKLGDSEIKIHLKRVPKGSLIMGISEEQFNQLVSEHSGNAVTRDVEVIDSSNRNVKIDHDYFIGKYEVSKEQYAQFESTLDYPEEEKDLPVTNIHLQQVKEFCAWLNQQYEAYEIRLPTETEWEYAAKGDSENIYTWGMEYDKNKANLESDRLFPVGSKVDSDSWIGASDMLGNASEMCSIDDEIYQKNDPSSAVCARGCSYSCNSLFATTTGRHLLYNAENEEVGFRVVAVPIKE